MSVLVTWSRVVQSRDVGSRVFSRPIGCECQLETSAVRWLPLKRVVYFYAEF